MQCDERQAATPPSYTIALNRDRLIQLARLVQWLEERTGRRHDRSMTYRWRQRGVRGADGNIYYLPTVRIGGVRYTSEEALAWWCAVRDGRSAAVAAAHAAAVATDAEDEATLRRAGVV